MVAASSKGSTPNRTVPPFGHELFEVAVLPVPPHETASSVHAISAKTVGRRRARGIRDPPPVTSRRGAHACQAVVSTRHGGYRKESPRGRAGQPPECRPVRVR